MSNLPWKELVKEGYTKEFRIMSMKIRMIIETILIVIDWEEGTVSISSKYEVIKGSDWRRLGWEVIVAQYCGLMFVFLNDFDS